MEKIFSYQKLSLARFLFFQIRIYFRHQYYNKDLHFVNLEQQQKFMKHLHRNSLNFYNNLLAIFYLILFDFH